MLLGEETSGNHQAYRRGHLDITSFPFLHFHGRLINASLPLFTFKSQGHCK